MNDTQATLESSFSGNIFIVGKVLYELKSYCHIHNLAFTVTGDDRFLFQRTIAFKADGDYELLKPIVDWMRQVGGEI